MRFIATPFVVGWLFILFSSSFSQALLAQISEAQLIKMAKQSNPVVDQAGATQARAQAESHAVRSRFDTQLKANYQYGSSNEQAIIPFIPVFHPQKQFELGLVQALPVGMQVSAGVFGQQLNTRDGTISNATQFGSRVGLQIDLWKNFLGGIDRAELQAKKISEEVAKIQEDIDVNSFILDIRKIYWALVANQMSLDLSQRLVKTASQQYKDARRQRKDGVGDRGDVSRNLAQLKSRESAALVFASQKEILLSRLKALVPDVDITSFRVSTRGALNMEKGTKQCMKVLSGQKQFSAKHTPYTKVVSLLTDQKSKEIRVADATDSIDLKLQAQYQASGVDNSHSEAFDRWNEDFRNGYSAGVSLSIPLGDDLKKVRESRKRAVDLQFSAQIQRLKLMLGAEHHKIKRAFQILGQAAESQNGIVGNLNVSLKQTRRKYKQARIPLSSYIFEQDNLFNAKLQLINTKTEIVNLLLDYLKVFPHHPCAQMASEGV